LSVNLRTGTKAENEPIGIAGSGRVASALGRLLRERGAPVVAIAGRDPGRTAEAARFIAGIEAVGLEALPGRASRVIIAVTDAAITPVAQALAAAGMKRGIALHTCGASACEALEPLSAQGVSCGALHPLQTFSTPEFGVARLPGSAFGFTGEGPAADWATEIVELLGGTLIRVPAERRAIYHAAAVMASNYVVGLIDAAATLMQRAGADERTSLRAIEPLARASIENAFAMGPLKALTGPVERGDVETVARHCEALDDADPEIADLYRAVGIHLLKLAQARGLSEAQAVELKTILGKARVK
jgi:predicted short-subunit dehydrogenase-like oxidoreductase (DUF2520 family)